MKITRVVTADVRFPTSVDLAGSDAMHPDPDYSAAYVTLETDGDLAGDGFTFTIGRGNDLCVAAIAALGRQLVGVDVRDLERDLGPIARSLTNDTQLRWLGPEKGVIHLAAGALINALWDLRAKAAGVPVWKLLADLSPVEIVALVDWRHLTDALTPEEAVELLERAVPGRAERERRLLAEGLPAYTTSAGWIGYPDDVVAARCADVVAAGYRQVKIKVGASAEDDLRRVRLVRETIGPDIRLAVDANQTWEVAEAIERIRQLERYDLAWVEEPTSPDDILGHLAIADAVEVPIATGEHCQNRVMFKQFLRSGAMEICQIDACRVAGVNENIATLLLAAKYGVPVCPHAGGVGLCELVQHLSMFDFVAVAGDQPGRIIEMADHLHEHFLHPVDIRDGRYRAPAVPGFTSTMHAGSIAAFRFPDGPVWSGR
ncbi:MAG TPA: enolase C-terminal domain-like protein [Acidimicrobiales bacterium]|nr:enolase C-terminal domain-like protein [Acidimicrobiales bacterium]